VGKYNCGMENLEETIKTKYQVTISFDMDEAFMTLVPQHRVYINNLIEKNIVDTYTVSMETQRCWIILNAVNKKEVKKILALSPLHKYWTIEIDELFVYDGYAYRLPALQLN
jgi:hypothetical protein